MPTETVQEEIVFTLRVPVLLNEKLVSEAKSENRSRQSHIIFLLNKHFSENRKTKEAAKK